MAVQEEPGLLAVFWDIENCCVPRGKSAMAVVHCIRDKFLCDNRKEAEFLCVCDVSKEPKHLVAELNDAQIAVVHISNEHKNAADEKLRQCMRKFCDSHKAPVTLVLLSGDVDFATDLSHMRHTHKYKIILVHNQSSLAVKQALAITAHETYKFEDIVANAPEKEQFEGAAIDYNCVHWVHLTDLPNNVELHKIKCRLYGMASKTKGTVIYISKKLAIIQYTQPTTAERATKRMNGQDVFGSKISASHVTNAQSTSDFSNGQLIGPGYMTNMASHGRTGNPGSFPHSVQGKGLLDHAYSELSNYPTPPDSAGTRSATGNPPQSPLPNSDPGSAFSRTPGSKKTKSDSSAATASGVGMITSTPQSSLDPSRDVCSAPHKPFKSSTGYRPWDDFNKVWTASPGSNSQQRSMQLPYGSPMTNSPAALSGFGTMPCMFRPIQHGRPLYTSYNQVPPTPYNTPTTPRTLPHHGRTLSPMNSSPFNAGISSMSRPITGQQSRSPALNSDMRREGSPFLDGSGNEGIALSVTNLDYNISGREWKKILHQTFQQYVQVLSVAVQSQSDGSCMALLYVPNQEDARFAISQCHRKKIGYKRIQVSMYSPESPNNAQRVRSEVASILGEVQGNTLPLFKFIEIYEKRTISVSELYHMKDTVEIKEQSGKGRMVCLQTTLAAMPLNQFSCGDPSKALDKLEFQESPFCRLHCKEADFTLLEETGMLPYVKIGLEKFSQHVITLVQLHDGDLPLMSFTYCYSAAYSELKSAAEGGVPLEHLISCVRGVFIKVDELGVKKIMWQESRPSSPAGSSFSEASSTDSFSGRTSQTLSQQLSQFSREVVDLLKRMPGCQMSFSKFIPSYHHHFGRQCRVADFGFTKLLELFEAIPHVLQILGTGNQRILYLTHRIHLRRFTADLLRVLKAQPEKQCAISDFPELYSEVIGCDLSMPSFGVCYIEDLLIEVSDSQVVLNGGTGDQAFISIPKKDQTPEEIERTKQFSYEVIDLLKNCPQCTMVFNKFIPSYHHHFGRQCRVADYGFSKLIELFEAIPEIVNISESGEERYIALTKTELYKVLSEQLLALLSNCTNNTIGIKELGPAYQKAYGHNVYIEEFGVTSIEELVGKIPHIAHVESQDGVPVIAMNIRLELECLARRCLELLISRSNGEMRLSKFMERFNTHFDDHANLVEVKHSLFPAIIITEDSKCGTISLHPLLGIARRIMLLLSNNQGKLTLLTFEMAYRQSFGISLNSQQCGFPGVAVMLQMMDFMVSIRGRGARQTILLRQDFLARLAHQLAYKVGIYTELVKYKDMTKKIENRPSASTDSGIMDETFMGRNESIHAGSPDIFVTGLSTDMASWEMPSSHMSLSQNRLGLSSDIFTQSNSSHSQELNNACRMLSSLSMDESKPVILARKPLTYQPANNTTSAGSSSSNVVLLRNPSQQSSQVNHASPKHRRLAAGFDSVS